MARNARLGMSIRGGGDDGPPPGSPEFGERAKDRMRRLMGRKDFGNDPGGEQLKEATKGIRLARGKRRSGGYGSVA